MTPQAIQSAGKDELQDELLKIKARQKRLQDENKEKTSRTVGIALTVASGAGFSWFMGSKAKEVYKDAGGEDAFKALPAEEQEKKLKEKQAVAGTFDIDLLVGIGAVVAAMSDAAGSEYSGMFAAIGTGALTSFAARQAYATGAKPDEETTSG